MNVERQSPSKHASTASDATLQLLQGTVELFPLLIQDIDAAQHTVQLETYIFDTKGSGAEVAQALERAALRGVKVRLVVDGYGTPEWPVEWAQRFQSAGVQTLVFEPIVTFGFFIPSQWRRLHRKLVVIDSNLGYCGGINILDDFYDPNHGVLTSARFDFCVRVSGAIAQTMHAVTHQLWEKMAPHELGKATVSDKMLSALEYFTKSTLRTQFKNNPQVNQNTIAYLVLRDNVSHRSEIERAYLQAIGESRKDIIIANAYFLPGAKIRKALIRAAKRGVTVQLLLQGRYEYFLQYHAARPVYGALLAAGIEIYEYAPSYLHAKVAVIDGVWATVGSSNLDPLSLLLAREANVVVQDTAFATSLRDRLSYAMHHDSKRVLHSELASRPWAQRIRDRIAFAFMRTSLWFIGKRY